MEDESPWKKILNIAKNAPSGGNVQPWVVVIENDRVFIKIDEEINRLESYIFLGALFSIGALAHNIVAVANSLGFLTNIKFPENPCDNIVITIKGYDGQLLDEEYINVIQNRCTNRKPTIGIIPEEVLIQINKKLEAFLIQNNLPNFKLVRTREKITKQSISELLSELEYLRFSNLKTRDKFFMEIKCHEDDYVNRIALKTLELPLLMEKLMCFMIRIPVLRKLLFPKLVQLIVKDQLIHSSDIACFFGSKSEAPTQFIELGYAVQFFWLELNKCGYSMQPWTSLSFYYHEKQFNRPLTFSNEEVEKIDALVYQFGNMLNEKALEPLFIFRMHDAEPPKYRSSKKPIV